jgi:hypothetical protein
MSIDCNDSLTINIDKNKEESAKILGVNRDADIREVKKQYFKLAAKYHPDKGGDKETFQKISNAYSFLVDIPEYEADYKKRCDEEDEVQANPTDPASAKEPIVVSTAPIDAKVPTETKVPTDATEPVKVNEPSDTYIPTEPANPYVPFVPFVPFVPTKPTEPVKVNEPTIPTEPVKPYVPIDSKVPTESIQPVEIIRPSVPSVSTTVSEPLQLIQSNRPLDTMNPPLPAVPAPALVLPPNNLAKIPLDENNEICLVFDTNKKFPVAFIPCQKKKSNTFKTGGRKMRKSKRRLHKSRKGHKKNKKQRTCKRR